LPAGLLNYILIFSKENAHDLSFLAGFSEESLKFLAFVFFIMNRIEFNERMDAIVYGTLISLGFATFENYEYVFIYNEPFSSFEVAQLRSVTAIPLHSFCGIMMGYFLGLYKYKKNKAFLVPSLCLPIFFHAVYNYLENLFYIFLLIGALFLFCLYLHNELRVLQRSKRKENEFN